MNLLLVDVLHVLLVTNVVTNLHLLLDQVLGLNERANELVSFLTLQDPNLVLVHHVGLLKLLFLGLKFVLLVDELLAKDSFLIIQVEEDAQIFRHLIVLLSLNDTLDLALFGDLLPDTVYLDDLLLGRLGQEALLLFTVNLSLQVALLPELLLKQRLMVLIKLSCLPEAHLQTTCGPSLIGILRCLLQHFLLNALTRLVSWGEVSCVKLGLSVVIDDLLVKLATLLLISDRNEQVLFVELDRLKFSRFLEHLCVFLCRNHALMGL